MIICISKNSDFIALPEKRNNAYLCTKRDTQLADLRCNPLDLTYLKPSEFISRPFPEFALFLQGNKSCRDNNLNNDKIMAARGAYEKS
jgi:hypothetical protein